MISDYKKYRGKCKEMSEELCKLDSSLTIVRGHYYCPIWDREEQHWWCVDEDGKINDPTKNQFPSRGMGEYIPFDGTVECAECGKKMLEKDATFESRYAFCSHRCVMKFVGIM